MAQNPETIRTDINPALFYFQAFEVAPRLDENDRDYLDTNQWKAPHLDEHFGKLVAEYDNTFRLVRQAAQSKVPCDWGIDWSTGPATLLPELGQAKVVAIAANWRVKWDLQNGCQDDAREDLVAALALGRNATRDGTLISVLVQQAIESILCSSFAENFGRFNPEQWPKIVDGMDACPARGTVADTITSEKSIFIQNWLLRKVEELRKANPGDDRAVMDGVRKLVTNAESETNFWPLVEKLRAPERCLVRLLHEREVSADRMVELIASPAEEFQVKEGELEAEFTNSPNPFIAVGQPPFLKARERELRALTYLALVQAGCRIQTPRRSGSRRIPDPAATGRSSFSVSSLKEWIAALLDLRIRHVRQQGHAGFVEKEGPPFQVKTARPRPTRSLPAPPPNAFPPGDRDIPPGILVYTRNQFSVTSTSATKPQTRRARSTGPAAEMRTPSAEVCRAHETRLLRQATALCGNPLLAEISRRTRSRKKSLRLLIQLAAGRILIPSPVDK